MKYELENLKQERQLEDLRHEKELREFQSKADADFRKFQVRFLFSFWSHYCLCSYLFVYMNTDKFCFDFD